MYLETPQPTGSVPTVHGPTSRVINRLQRLRNGLGAAMIRIVVLALVLATLAGPASAFKFIGPNGYMEPAPEDIARRKAEAQAREDQERWRAEADRAWAEEQARIEEHNARMNAMYRSQNPVDPSLFTCPPPRNKYNDGPAPGGHRRHAWRERTGFNTPAHRTRYENEIRRLNRELKKERAKPNPAGDHPTKMRKQIKTKF